MLSPITSAPLNIPESFQRGWQAFCRSPWAFIGFTLVGGSANVIGQSLQKLGSDRLELSSSGGGSAGGGTLLALLPLLLGIGISVVSSLWLNVGLFRGAWIALAGRKPQLGDLIRWDGPAQLRLLLMGLLLLLINLLILVVSGLAAAVLSLIQPMLSLLPVLIGLGVFVYVAVGQVFHLPLTVIGGLNPLPAFRSGRIALATHWWTMLGFLALLALIVLAGVLSFGAGLIVGLPVISCVVAAAYQQLFGQEDRTGLLAYR
ncbi:MAG: hypothetical protein R6W06_00410 [Prochlorococcaceae cyanobacterium]